MGRSRGSVLSPAPPDLLGYEVPRVFTPPLRPLTPKTSLGFALIDFARDVVGMELLPWQRWLAIHALELLPDGTFRFRTVLLLVARQNGKSTFLQILALFFLYVRGVNLVIGTAQNLDIAEEVWQGAVDIAEGVPELAAEIANVAMVNGKKALELRRGERYKVQAANRRGGRGLAGDLVMLDELREHQTWDAWAAVTKTTMARQYAQVWAASNAGDKASVVLRFLRKLAHAALGDPDGINDATAEPVVEIDDDSLGIFEWSAAPDCDPADTDGQRQANPSLGHTITHRAIRSALRTDPPTVFRTEVLCQEAEDDDDVTGVFDGRWPALADPKAERGSPGFGVAVAPDRSWSAVGVAWKRPDGRTQVMLADYRPGTDWLRGRVAELREKWQGAVTANTAAKGIVPGANEPPQTEQALAHTGLDDAVSADLIRHGNEPALNTAVRAARWKAFGDTRMLDRKGSADITPLDAAALAVHTITQAGPSVYEERGLSTL